MGKTAISWCDVVWNPIIGCSLVSPGCSHCYAMAMANRLERMGMTRYQGLTTVVNGHAVWTGQIHTVPEVLERPLRWKKPRKIFVNSMSDLFHEAVDVWDLENVFSIMEAANWHIFQVLTKRSKRLRDEVTSHAEWLSYAAGPGAYAKKFHHVWWGVSVENREALHRIDNLRATPASVRFLSIEPLLEDLGSLNLDGISWVIVGGESGPHYRQMFWQWLASIVMQCRAAHVPVFVKQDAGPRPSLQGRIPDFYWAHKQFPRD